MLGVASITLYPVPGAAGDSRFRLETKRIAILPEPEAHRNLGQTAASSIHCIRDDDGIGAISPNDLCDQESRNGEIRR